MGRLPAEVRALTPKETDLLIEGWNAANEADTGPAAPTDAEYEELVRKYG
jgi:hypothetical protein